MFPGYTMLNIVFHIWYPQAIGSIYLSMCGASDPVVVVLGMHLSVNITTPESLQIAQIVLDSSWVCTFMIKCWWHTEDWNLLLVVEQCVNASGKFCYETWRFITKIQMFLRAVLWWVRVGVFTHSGKEGGIPQSAGWYSFRAQVGVWFCARAQNGQGNTKGLLEAPMTNVLFPQAAVWHVSLVWIANPFLCEEKKSNGSECNLKFTAFSKEKHGSSQSN